MDNKSDYTIEELLFDQSFIDWVKNDSISLEWDAIIASNPENAHQIQIAKNLILQVSTPINSSKSLELRNKVWDNIEINIGEKRRNRWPKIFAGASFLLLFVLFFFYNKYPKGQNDHAVVSNLNLIEYTNNTNGNWPIDLSDGSQVILEPNAYLKYPLAFNGQNRKVELKGDAFFDIAHDSLSPFYVYANEAVVRVIGTSFYVKAEEDDKDVQVIVKTGKVAVYKGNEVKEYQAKRLKSIEPLLVTPNQIATLNKSSLEFNKRLVSRPTLIQTLESLDKIQFDNNSIHEIASALEIAYGIDIEIDSGISSNCRLTTTLTDQPLFEKLKIICDPLGLKYLEKDIKIHIIGNCQ